MASNGLIQLTKSVSIVHKIMACGTVNFMIQPTWSVPRIKSTMGRIGIRALR